MRDKSVHTLNNRYESLPESQWKNLATDDGTTFVRRGDSTSIVLTDPEYPMKIKNAIVSSSIVQSSPYPCDKNTITVTLVTDIDLYPRCTPSLSLTGLEQSGTASGQLTATVAQTGDRPGTWTNADGILIFNIFHDDDAQSSATTAGDADAIKVGVEIPNYTVVSFSFELTNPQSQQDSPLTALSLKMIDTPPVGVADYTAAFHVEANHDSSTMTFYSTNGLVINDKDICSNSPQDMDARPLRIRSVTFTKLQVSQTSAYPCASNTISVVFQADGPIFSSCVNVLTLSGLSGSVTTGSRTLTSVSHG